MRAYFKSPPPKIKILAILTTALLAPVNLYASTSSLLEQQYKSEITSLNHEIDDLV